VTGNSRWAWVAFTLVLGSFAAGVSYSKAVGALWLVLVMAGLVGCWRLRADLTRLDPQWLRGVRYWLIAALGAIAWRIPPSLVWGDSLGLRHVEWRMALTAASLPGLVLLAARGGCWSSVVKALPWGLAAFGLASWVLVLQGTLASDRWMATNRIPWSVSVAMGALFLLGFATLEFSTHISNRARVGYSPLIFGVPSVISLISVGLSGQRGAYPVLLIWPTCLFLIFWRREQIARRKAVFPIKISLFFGIFGLAVLSLYQFGVWERLELRLIQAIQEWQVASSGSGSEFTETSVGARFYLWSRALASIFENPFMGYGVQGRIELIAQWAHETQSMQLATLRHLHNEYLNAWVDHGVWGVISLVWLFIVGWWANRTMFLNRETAPFGVTMTGAWILLAISLVANVNFAHHFMGIMASLCLMSVSATAGLRGCPKSHPSPL
jgi:O-antigen ligase